MLVAVVFCIGEILCWLRSPFIFVESCVGCGRLSYWWNPMLVAVAFCIGETTGNIARQYFEDVRIAKVPTVESVIELVNEHYV